MWHALVHGSVFDNTTNASLCKNKTTKGRFIHAKREKWNSQKFTPRVIGPTNRGRARMGGKGRGSGRSSGKTTTLDSARRRTIFYSSVLLEALDLSWMILPVPTINTPEFQSPVVQNVLHGFQRKFIHPYFQFCKNARNQFFLCLVVWPANKISLFGM